MNGPRFAPVSVAKTNQIQQAKVSHNSLRSEETWERVYNEWASSLSEPIPTLEQTLVEDLAAHLSTFILAVRTQKGEVYAPSSYPVMCSAILRSFNRKHGTAYDFFSDPLFKDAFATLDGYVHHLQSTTTAKKNPALPLTKQLRKQLMDSSYFSPTTPEGLLHRTYLAVSAVGARLEWHYNLQQGRVRLTATEEEDVLIFSGVPDKNHPGGVAALGSEKSWEKTLYPNRSEQYCPLSIVALYRSHCPEITANSPFYLRPIRKPKGEIWYKKQKVGRQYLGKLRIIPKTKVLTLY